MEFDIEALLKSHKQLTLINERQTERTRHEQTKATTLTIGYVISQGAILISISNRSALQCEDWFVPFSLSLLLGVVYFVTFWEAVNRWYHTQYHLELNYLDAKALLLQIYHPHSQSPDHRPLEPDAVQLMRRRSFMGVLILAFAGLPRCDVIRLQIFSLPWLIVINELNSSHVKLSSWNVF